MPNRPALDQREAGQVERAAGPWLSRRRRRASGTSTRPIGTLSQKIHCQEMPSTTAPPTTGPERDGEAADPAPGAERQAALLGRDGVREQRQRERRDDRAADALDRPGDDERLDRRRERRERPRRP